MCFRLNTDTELNAICRYYYQYDQIRLPVCVLTHHAVLHIVKGIRKAAPVWALWTFIVERYCGRLAKAVTSRQHPYAVMNRHILETAHLQAITSQFSLQDKLPSHSKTWRTRRKPNTIRPDQNCEILHLLLSFGYSSLSRSSPRPSRQENFMFPPFCRSQAHCRISSNAIQLQSSGNPQDRP